MIKQVLGAMILLHRLTPTNMRLLDQRLLAMTE